MDAVSKWRSFEELTWTLEQQAWEAEHERWLQTRESWENEAKSSCRASWCDRFGVEVLSMQVEEADTRWLMEMEALQLAFEVWEHCVAVYGVATNDTQKRLTDTQVLLSAAADEVLALERNLENYDKGAARFALSPPAKLPRLVNEAWDEPAPRLRDTPGDDALAQRMQEQRDWAQKRQQLKEKLKLKRTQLRSSQQPPDPPERGPVSVSFEAPTQHKLLSLLSGEQLPVVVAHVHSLDLPDVPVTLHATEPLRLEGEFTRMLHKGTATFAGLVVHGPVGAAGKLLVCYPRCAVGSLESRRHDACVAGPFLAEMDVVIEVAGKVAVNPWEIVPMETDACNGECWTADSALYDDGSSLGKDAVLHRNNIFVLALEESEGEQILALGGDHSVRLAYYVEGKWDVQMSLLTGERVRGVIWHKQYLVVVAASATFVWERKFIDTWRAYTTSLPSTTVRYKLPPARGAAACDDFTVLAVQNELQWYASGTVSRTQVYNETVRQVLSLDGELFVALESCVVRGHFERGEIVFQGKPACIAATQFRTDRQPGWLLAVAGLEEGRLSICGARQVAVREALGDVHQLEFSCSGDVLVCCAGDYVTLIDANRGWLIRKLPACTAVCPLRGSLVVQGSPSVPGDHPRIQIDLAVGSPLDIIMVRTRPADAETAPGACEYAEPVAIRTPGTVPGFLIPDDVVSGASFPSDACSVVSSAVSGGVRGKPNAGFARQTAGHVGVRVRDGSKGAVVVSVAKGSPADKAELRANDAIVGVGDAVVKLASEFREAVQKLNPGDLARVCYVRDDEVREAVVKIDRKQPAPAHPAQDPAGALHALRPPALSPGGALRPAAASFINTDHGRRFCKKQGPPPVLLPSPCPRDGCSVYTRSRSRSPSAVSPAPSRSVSPCERSVSASSFASFASQLPPHVPWSAAEQRNLSTSHFHGTTLLARCQGFLKANGQPIPTPANEATLRKSVVKHILKCKHKNAPYVDWWNLTRVPQRFL